MARKLSTILTLVILSLMVQSVEAFWLDALYCHLERGCQENDVWPKQYLAADRANTQAPFNVMIQNGWRRQNLLGPHHFNHDCTALTDAGKLRVQWILTQPPAQHRQVFIERSLSDEITQARIAAATEFASTVIRDGSEPSIMDSHIMSTGRPATIVNYVNTTFRDNMPTPSLPDSSYDASGN